MQIINARLYTCDEAGIIENGFIETNGAVITGLGDMKSCTVLPEAIDAEGKTVYPGFVDAHTHIGMFEDGSGEAGNDGNEDTDPNTANLLASDGLNPFDKCFGEALSGGVTCAVVSPGSSNVICGMCCAVKMGGAENGFHTYDDIIIRDRISMKMALGENPKFTYSEKNASPVTRMANAAILREALEKAAEYDRNLKKYEKDPENCDAPEYDAKNEALADVINKKIPVHIHAHRADDICTAIRIKNKYGLNMVIVHATEGHMIADTLSKNNISAMVGPSLCDRGKEEMKNMSVKTTADLIHSGIPTAIITDHPETPLQYLPVCAGLAIRGGADFDEAIRAITINPAKICGIDNRVGSLKIGKDADFSIYKNDPTDIKNEPKMVFVNGKRVR